MSRSWLAGGILFLLGFGCAKVVTLPLAGASVTDGTVDGTLEYIDGKDEFELIYAPGGDAEYLVIASRTAAPGSTPNPQISYDTGSAVLTKDDLVSFTVFRVEPLMQWRDTTGSNIICDPAQPTLCPVPPPPGPPLFNHYRFLKPL